MKNDKICINKSVMFISVVLVILVGVVMATNYVNNQKLSTKSRADFDRDAITPVPGTAVVMSTFKLSELKTRAEEAIKKLDNVLVVSLNKDQVNAKKEAVVAGVSKASDSFTNTSTLVKKVALNTDTRQAGLETLLSQTKTAVSNLELSLAAEDMKVESANKNHNIAVTARDVTLKEVQKLENDSDKALADLNSAQVLLQQSEKVAGDKRIITNGKIESLLSSTITSDPQWDGAFTAELNRLKTTRDDNVQYATKADIIANDIVNAGVVANSEYNFFKYNISEVKKANDDVDNDQAKVNSLNASSDQLLVNLKEAKRKDDLAKNDVDDMAKLLDEAKAKRDEVKQKYDLAVNQQKTVEAMISTLKSFKVDLSDFSNRLNEVSVLPPQLQALVVPTPSYNMDTASIIDTNADVTSVNTALLATSNAYDALDKAITEGMAEKQAQLDNNETYCNNIVSGGIVYHSVLAYDVDGNLVNGGEIPDVVQLYYNKWCKANETKPLWNGQYGGDAKCYKTIGICSSKDPKVEGGKAVTAWDLANVGPNKEGTPQMCINREVDLKECIAKRSAPNSVQESTQLCKDYGKFGWVGMGSYSVIQDVKTYLGAQPATPTPAKTGLSNTCVLLRPGTTDVPCVAISPRFCQYQDAGYVAQVDAKGNKTGKYVDSNDATKVWDAPSFDAKY